MSAELNRRIAAALGFEVYEMSAEEKACLVDEQKNRRCFNFRAPGYYFQYAWRDPDSLWDMLPDWSGRYDEAFELLATVRWTCEKVYDTYTVRIDISIMPVGNDDPVQWRAFTGEAATFAEAACEAWVSWREVGE